MGNDDHEPSSTELVTSIFARGLRMLAEAPQIWRSGTIAPEREPKDFAADLIQSTLERWRRGASLLRSGPFAGHDQIATSGGWVELSAALDPISRQMARSVRFYEGDQLLGEVEADGHGCVYLAHRASGLGLHRVEVEVRTVGDRVLSSRQKRAPLLVQVVDEAPVVVVAAQALFEAPAELAELLAPLRDSEVQVVYASPVGEYRVESARTEMERHALPLGALLVLNERESVRTLGVDFDAVFASVALRRLRASGIGVALVVGADATTAAACAAEGIEAITLDALRHRRLDASEIADLHERAERVRAARRAEASELGWRLVSMTDARPVAGNACRVELDNHAARERLLQEISDARRSVHLQFYIFQESRFTEELAVHLIRKAREGVTVRLVVDALYSGQEILGVKNRLVTGLGEEPGIHVLASDPIETTEQVQAVRLKERDHKKLVVIDDRVAFISGRNAGDEYYVGFDEVPITDFSLHERIPWLDAHMEVRGPLVAQVQQTFADNWVRNGGPPFDVAEPSGPAGNTRARLVVHEGVRDANAMGAYEAILDSARDHVLIVNDFPVLASLAASVRRAVGRGVEVHFLTGNALARRGDGTFFKGPVHRELFEYMTKKRLEPLMHAGVAVYEYTTPALPNVVARGGVIRPYVHAKIMTADGVVASVGSANLDVTASYWEREAMVVAEGAEVVAPLEARLRTMIGRSLRIDLESDYWKKETAQRELISRAWPDSFYS